MFKLALKILILDFI